MNHDDSTWWDPQSASARPSTNCPDPVWHQLPGGPVALNDALGEVWEYMTLVADRRHTFYEFRHRSHPGYDGARVYAWVVEDDKGPELAFLEVDGREQALPSEQGDEE